MKENSLGYEILHTLPNTTSLGINQNLDILATYGTHSNHFKNYSFDEKTKDQIKDLQNKKLEKFILTLDKLKFEARYSKDFVYLYDVSEYSNIQQKLQKSLNDLLSKKEELQAVFDLAANGISILNKEGKFLYANNFFRKMIGYTMDELKEESCISLSTPEYVEPSRQAVQNAIKNGSIENFRKICVSKQGKQLHSSMSLSYIKSTDEIVMITSDITKDIRYQEELKQQVEIEVKKRAEQYEVMFHQSRLAAMGEMINSIAHQWRQPLNALGLIIQGLRHISKQKQINQELLNEIESEIMEKINFMSLTIDDFSNFFKVSKQKEIFNIYGSINDAIRLIEVQLKNKNITLNLDRSYSDIQINGFANEFRQVILNLITNAMNAIKKDGKIDIKIKSKDDLIFISIKDTGGGIEKSNINKIFEPYFTTKDKGTGIGLYMSKIIIEHHMDGKLEVENIKDGACFKIQLKGTNGSDT